MSLSASEGTRTMPITLMILLAIHVLSAVFWAGSTFTLARAGGVGSDELFKPQMGAAVVAFLTGVGLWMMLHQGAHSAVEQILGVGIVAAVAAAGVQGALRRKPATGQRIAAILLAITTVCMVVARYAA
jgi:hypothetical protein